MFSETMSIAAKLANGFGLTILGMGVVFAILAVLSFALDGLRVLLADKEKSASGPVKKDPPPAPVQRKVQREDSEDLIAVITAAVAVFTEKPADTVIVKSIRQIPRTNPVWGAVGRQKQMSDRF